MITATLRARSLAPALTVGDLKRSIHFYSEGLGFTLGEQMEENGEVQGVMREARWS